MRFDCQCPWCGADTSVRGSDKAAWRFQLPCELCSRDMVVTYDGVLLVSRCADGPIERSREQTVRIRVARAS